MSNSQWHEDQSIGERALREHKKEQENLRTDNAKLREENARLRAALRGLFKPDSVPYAQWTREMHAAHVALESEP
jgi:hypothetical protein